MTNLDVSEPLFDYFLVGLFSSLLLVLLNRRLSRKHGHQEVNKQHRFFTTSAEAGWCTMRLAPSICRPKLKSLRVMVMSARTIDECSYF